MVLPQFLLPILLPGCAQGKPNGVEKKIFGNCGNAIAENEKKKKNVLAIVAMSLPKMEKKKFCFGNCGNGIAKNGGKKKRCYEICERVKKKVVTSTIFLQHFHNKSHMISYY